MPAKNAPAEPITKIQKLIGSRMLDSKQTKPCFYLTVKTDMTEISRTRRNYSKSVGTRVATNDFLIRAMALGIEQFPLMAADLEDEYLRIADTINVGLAVAAPQGLVVPVIKDANIKTLPQIAADSAELIRMAKGNSLNLDHLERATITLTNLGMYSIESFIAIVSPCQCSILSVGRLIDTPIPVGDDIMMRRMMNLTLAVDHRIVNGAYAAQFLSYIMGLLEKPAVLME